MSEWMVFRPCRYLWKSLIFVLYLSLLFSLLFFALVVWFFCFVIYVKVGWGRALSFIFIFAEGGRTFVVLICLLIPLCMGICCVYLLIPPQMYCRRIIHIVIMSIFFIVLLLDLFFDTTRDHLKQRVFSILILFLLCLFIILSVPVYESFANNTCTHLYYIP